MTEFVAFLVVLAIAGIAFLIWGDDPGSKLEDTGGGERLPTADLPAVGFTLRGSCEVRLIRQSGFIYREIGVFPSVDEAIEEVLRSFKRAKIDWVRVTHSDEQSLAIYRQNYDFTGRAHGKKLAGAVLEAVSNSQTSNLELLAYN